MGHIGFSFVLEKHLHHTEEIFFSSILFVTCKHSTTQMKDLFVHKSKLEKAAPIFVSTSLGYYHHRGDKCHSKFV
jgi:hypothetical protein